jgi:hypothetical protein
MAKDKQASTVGKIDPKVAELAKFLPQGFTLDDFVVVGGLRPIVTPELNQEQPFAAKIVALLQMPPREDGSKWSAILAFLMSPAKAQAGDETVAIEAGKEVLIPVGGNLGNNADLLNAASSAENVYTGIFSVTGTLDTGKPSPMWVYEVRIAKNKPEKRTGQFALYNKPAPELNAAPGDVRKANGEPAGSLVGGASA